MNERTYKVLLIEDNPADALLFRETLADAGGNFRVTCAANLGAAIEQLIGSAAQWDIAVVDLTLPDSSGIETFERVLEAAPHVPIVIMSGVADEDLAIRAVQEGAQDYLVKGQVEPIWLARSLRYAIERKRMQDALQRGEDRFQQLVEQASDAFFIVDAENCLVDVNREACQSLGYKRDELLALRLSDIVSDFDDAKAAQTWQAIRRREPVTFEGVHRKKDGSHFPVEIRMSLLELDGQFILALARDVTDRMKRQEAEEVVRIRAQQFEIAREIQQQLFPNQSPHVPGFDISGASYPADETGGDYYDFLPMLDGHIGIVIGDVGGHGVGPAILVGETHAYLRAFSQTHPDVEFMLQQVNQLLVEDVNELRLISLFFLRLDPSERSFVFSGAGHSAYLLSASGGVTLLDRRSIPLGIDKDAKFPCSPSQLLQPNDLVLMCTDGINETSNTSGEQFGDKRLLKVIQANRDRSAREIIDALYQAVRDFAGDEPQHDDITVVITKVLP